MRAGDKVHHTPTGEDWIVAYVDGEHMAWCGWPEGEAKVADCTVTEACTDAEHRLWLSKIAMGDGKRARMAKAALEALQPVT